MYVNAVRACSRTSQTGVLASPTAHLCVPEESSTTFVLRVLLDSSCAK